MKSLLILLITTLTLALPVGLTTELITEFGYSIVRSASSNLRAQYPPVRQQLTQKLADDPTTPLKLVEDWNWQAQQSLHEQLPVLLPYAERWLVLPATSQVVTFTVFAEQGRILDISTQHEPTAQGGLLIEVFDLKSHDTQPVAAIGPTDNQLRWPVSTSGNYRVRVQSTPGTVGAFALVLDEGFALEFPVDTDAAEPVRSLFGVPRDGGKREHHGIDIFAPRHTPVIAAADGYVSRVGNSPRGGLHIWQRASDESGDAMGTLYYAHLEDTFVAAGTWVNRGTPIGTVGNSGNAITTPPHLHFGLYQRYKGPLDPLPLTGSAQRPRVSMSNGHRWPVWVSVTRASVNVRAGPGTGHAVKATASRGELVAIEAATDGWLRIRTGSGERGFLSAALVGAPKDQTLVLEEQTLVQAAPAMSSPMLVVLQPQQSVRLLGRFGVARYVETDTGLRGWIIDVVDGDDEPAS